MRATLWFCAILSVASLSAGARMTVSVCTEGRPAELPRLRAQAVASSVYRMVNVEIAWAKCEDAPVGEEAARQHWYTIRLCGDPLMGSPGLLSLDTLGEAFLSEDGPGYLAEVYYNSAGELASRARVDSGTLLGYVMAHEIGHLLLGPGHAPEGVMRASWKSYDFDLIRMGRMKFHSEEGARIRQALETEPPKKLVVVTAVSR